MTIGQTRYLDSVIARWKSLENPNMKLLPMRVTKRRIYLIDGIPGEYPTDIMTTHLWKYFHKPEAERLCCKRTSTERGGQKSTQKSQEAHRPPFLHRFQYICESDTQLTYSTSRVHFKVCKVLTDSKPNLQVRE